MMDETIAPTRYRTGRGDRSIPGVLGLVLVLAAPFLAWASGPFFWPWGVAMAAASAGGGAVAYFRWRNASGSVLWVDGGGYLEFRYGRRVRRVDWAALTKVQVTPAAVRTKLWAGAVGYRLSHRLVRAEGLLEKLRSRRPDLFAQTSQRIVLRRSEASAALQGLLALGTGVAGFILGGWEVWVGAFFGVAAVYVLARILFFIPRSFAVEPGAVTTQYWWRRKQWGRPEGIREDGYAAGGAVFFRMVLDYGSWKVVFDEGQLLDPLRPVAGAIVHLLSSPPIG